MTLSEAIRLGAMVSPQSKGGWMDEVGRCALACAADAVGLEPVLLMHCISGELRPTVNYGRLAKVFPLLDSPAVHPVNRAYGLIQPDGLRVQDVIWSLNDCHGWTREAIATWVESVEVEAEIQAIYKGSAQ